MADILVTDDLLSGGDTTICPIVWVDTETCYFFYMNKTSSGTDDMAYVRSTDRGSTWDSPVNMFTLTNPGFFHGMSVWYDRWTKGDTGNLIHVVILRDDSGFVLYRDVDVSDNTLGTGRTVKTFTSAHTSRIDYCCSITKAIGGNLYISWRGDSSGEFGLERSTDAGVNWTSRTASFMEVGGASINDIAFMVPADWLSDDNDIACIFVDDSAGEVSLKEYDDSADSITETSIQTGLDSISATPIDCALRISDGHVLVILREKRATNPHDVAFWDINGGGSITQKTDVYTANHTDGGVSVLIDPEDSNLVYAVYGDKASGDTVVKYKTSTDGGTTWSSATDYSEAASLAGSFVYTPVAIDQGGAIGAIFRETVAQKAFINAVNAVVLSKYSTARAQATWRGI